MKKLVLTILLIVNSFIVMCQTWTQPVIASSTGGINQDADITIDTNGIIHLVWMHKYTQFFTKIFYNYSLDNGVTWTTGIDISKNDSIYIFQPKVACNDSGNILVTYDYNIAYSQVYMSSYNSGQWNDPALVSNGLPGMSYNNKAVVDSDGRFYVFWYNTSGKYYYKYKEEGVWSSLICPFCDSAGVYSFADFAIDTAGNLHWAGDFYYQSNPTESRLTHYFYNKQEELWASPELLTTNYVKPDKDIDLDTEQNPHIVWREREQVPLPEHEYTFYSYFNGENWSGQEMVIESEVNEHLSEQQIAIDGQDRQHIVQNERILNDMQLVHYQKIDGQWSAGYVIDIAENYLSDLKLIYYDNMLFLTYTKNDQSGDPLPVYFTRYDIVTGYDENMTDNHVPNYKLYPNPFRNNINIEFETKKQCLVQIYIIDLKGKLIKEINNSNLPKGKYHFNWDGTDMNNNKLPDAQYLVRMLSGRYQITKAIQLIE